MKFIILLLLFSSLAKAGYGEFGPSPSGKFVLVPWNSGGGILRFNQSAYKQDFFQLATNFQPQLNSVYCGVASSVIILNTLRLPQGKAPRARDLEIKRPQAFGGGMIPFPNYTQLTLLNTKTDKAVKSRKLVKMQNVTPENTHDANAFTPGFHLHELKKLLEFYNTKVEINYAKEPLRVGVKKFREKLKEILAMGEKKKFIIANFHGRTMGAPTGGHYSPIGAYDERTDNLLIMDVGGFKNPWYWAPVKKFYKAMHTRDGDKFRGYLIVRE